MIITSPESLGYKPTSIVTLVPSQTELLHYLGLEDETKAITKFCIHPSKWFHNKIRVGGTKSIDIERVTNLQPDLIIANKEENVKEQIEALASKFPVWVTDVSNLDEALKMIKAIGILTQTHVKASALVQLITERFSSLNKPTEAIPTAYLIWKNPYMAAGANTFIQDMLQHAGFQNIFADIPRYPVITIEEVLKRNCRLLMLTSEPYPFKQKDIDELQKQLPNTTICLVDGELFSWYGSRLLESPAYFKTLQQSFGKI